MKNIKNEETKKYSTDITNLQFIYQNNNSFENGKNRLVKILHEMTSALEEQKKQFNNFEDNMAKLDKELEQASNAFVSYDKSLHILMLKLKRSSSLHKKLSKTLTEK